MLFRKVNDPNELHLPDPSFNTNKFMSAANLHVPDPIYLVP